MHLVHQGMTQQEAPDVKKLEGFGKGWDMLGCNKTHFFQKETCCMYLHVLFSRKKWQRDRFLGSLMRSLGMLIWQAGYLKSQPLARSLLKREIRCWWRCFSKTKMVPDSCHAAMSCESVEAGNHVWSLSCYAILIYGQREIWYLMIFVSFMNNLLRIWNVSDPKIKLKRQDWVRKRHRGICKESGDGTIGVGGFDVLSAIVFSCCYPIDVIMMLSKTNWRWNWTHSTDPTWYLQAADHMGWRPLHRACFAGLAEVAGRLLRRDGWWSENPIAWCEAMGTKKLNMFI